jgi:hypothetical protein
MKAQDYMSEANHQHHILGNAESKGDGEIRRPYWKGVHRDWRIWVVVFFMLVGMLMYVMTEDFSVRPRSEPPPAGAAGR